MLLVSLLCAGATLFASGELFRYISGPDREPEPEPEPEPESELAMEPEFELAEHDDRGFGLSVSAVALSGLGTVFPIARLASATLVVIGIIPVAREAWSTLRSRRRLEYPGLIALGTATELALGSTSLASMGWLAFTGGQRLQRRSRRQTEIELTGAFQQFDTRAWLWRDGAELAIAIDDIGVEDVLIIRAGDAIPVDGRIIEGAVEVDQRSLTGESCLRTLVLDDEVLASTLVLSGRALIRPERTGAATLAARVEALLAESSSFEQSVRDRAGRESERSVRPTLALMGLGALRQGAVGALSGYWTSSSEAAWIGAPYSVINTIQAAARSSILIKDGRSLEQLTTIDTVVFDKTGTLTLDSFEVVRVHVHGDGCESELLGLAAALERRQQHPIAQAIVDAAERAGVSIFDPSEVETMIGYGIRARVQGRSVALGNARLLESERVCVLDHAVEAPHHSLIYLAVDGRHVASFELAPRIRTETAAVLDRLRARGFALMMVSGDEPAPCAELAARLGIAHYHAKALPEDKAKIVTDLQALGRRVCFIGDGLNDSLALQRANVSISMGDASFIARDSAQILLQGSSLQHLDTLFEIANDFAKDQRTIVKTGRMMSFVGGMAFMLVGASLSGLVWLYAGSLGFTFATAARPKLRQYGPPDTRAA